MSRNGHEPRKASSRTTRRRRWQRHRWLFGLLPLLALAAALLWLAPSIVAHSSLKHKIVSAALADFEGRVTIGSASLGWLSPLAAHDIAAVDRAGGMLAQVKSLRSERTLLGLLTNRRQPGGFRLEQPAIHLMIRPDGSNWEDALAVYLQQPSGDSSVERFQLQIIGGIVEIRDASGADPWRVDGLDADLQLTRQSEPRLQVRVAGQVHAAGVPAGRVSADLDCLMAGENGSVGEGGLSWQVDSLPMGPWASLLQRAGIEADLSGTLSGRGSVAWDADLENPQLRIEQLAGRDIELRAPQWLGRDTLATRTLDLRGQMMQAGNRWQFQDVHLATDFGQLEASGALPPLTVTGSWPALIRDLQKEPVQVAGQVHLKELARTLPETLRIRSGIEVNSGSIRFALASQRSGEPSFTASLDVDDLAATESGRTFAWAKPLSATADFRYTADGPVIDRLACQADFLQLTANGTLTDGSATVTGKLDRLKEEMGRFVELGELELAGQLKGDLGWQQTANGQVTATGRLQLNGFHFQNGEAKPWREEQLVVDLAAAADIAAGQIARIPAVSLQLRSERDVLNVRLLRPVESPLALAAWPIQLEAGGRLETWLPRLQPLWSPDGWELAGRVGLEAAATVTPDEIVAQKMQLQLDQLRAADASGRIVVDENAVRVDTAAKWERAANRVTATDATLTSSTVAFRAQELVLQLPTQSGALQPSDRGSGGTQPISASGKLSYRADLGRLTQWVRPSGSEQMRLSGAATGIVQASYQADAAHVDGTADIQNLVYATAPGLPAGAPTRTLSAPGWREVWREPSVRVSVRGVYDLTRDSLQLAGLSASAGSLQLAADGKIEQLSTQSRADLKGTLDYDLADLTGRLQASLGEHVTLVGRQQGHFTVKGPLFDPDVGTSGSGSTARLASSPTAPQPLVPPELAGTFGFGWQSAQAYGMHIGQGELNGTLSQCVLRLAALDIPVSEGRLRAAPRLELGAQPVRLMLDRGPLVENVLISPEICQSWLKYVAPLLADATRAEGRFSVSLDGASIPLPEAQAGSASGVLAIHSARVGPGPLAQEFLAIAQQVKSLLDGRPAGSSQAGTWLTVPEQRLSFNVQDGRVHHHGLTVSAGDVVMRTSGSVGLDQTLALVAEVPIQDPWVENKRLLETLRGTTLQVPIRGTLTRPQIDQRALNDLNRQVMQNAAGRVLEQEVGRGLERLFGPRP